MKKDAIRIRPCHYQNHLSRISSALTFCIFRPQSYQIGRGHQWWQQRRIFQGIWHLRSCISPTRRLAVWVGCKGGKWSQSYRSTQAFLIAQCLTASQQRQLWERLATFTRGDLRSSWATRHRGLSRRKWVGSTLTVAWLQSRCPFACVWLRTDSTLTLNLC